jgi:hypothetical protein
MAVADTVSGALPVTDNKVPPQSLDGSPEQGTAQGTVSVPDSRNRFDTCPYPWLEEREIRGSPTWLQTLRGPTLYSWMIYTKSTCFLLNPYLLVLTI